MKSCIFLLTLLGFVRIVLCFELSNVSSADDFDYACPYSLFRRKRANGEYTRWRANMHTTPQFIVKVLDEEIPTTPTNQIVAVNILPVTKRGEKIIVGGVMVPPPAPAAISPEGPPIPREYTRFVPPTTVDTHMDGDLYIAPAYTPPVGTIDDEPLKPTSDPRRADARFPQMQFAEQPNVMRDESPPSGPQFLERSQPQSLARQYAPITPVAFNTHSTETPRVTGGVIGPMTPPRVDEIQPSPTRSPFAGLTEPDSTPEEFVVFNTYPDEDVVEIAITRTTTIATPQHTTVKSTTSDFHDDDFEYSHTKKIDEEFFPKDNDANEKDVEASYNNLMFENDDYHAKTNKTDEDNKDFAPSVVRAENDIEIESFDNSSAVKDIYDDTEPAKDNASFIYLEPPITTEKPDREKRKCSLVKLRSLNFNSPRTLPEITAQLKKWAEDSPVARWVDITDGNLTAMENPIYMMIVDDPSNGQIVTAKHTVMVVAGIQGRDHHAVAAAMYILYQLIERSDAHSDLLSKYRFWIIPVFNPDGYDYAMTFPHRREWTKNLRQSWDACKGRESCKACETYGLRCTIQPCYGVNLDRNFEYQWIPADKLRQEHPCGSLYAGLRQLSEAETKALTHYLHDQRPPLYTFIVFKEGDVLGIMYPYSHTKKRRAFDQTYRQRASRAAAAAYSISGRPYVAGQTSEFLPLYAGGIEDWVDGHLGIDNTYTIMMFRPSDDSNSRLMTERAVHEAYAAMDTLLLQSLIESPAAAAVDAKPPNAQLTRRLSRSSAPAPAPSVLASYVYLIAALLAHLLS